MIPIFIVCPVETIAVTAPGRPDKVLVNFPVNLAAVESMYKGVAGYWELEIAEYTIRFRGADVDWHFLAEKERDDVYNAILNEYGERVSLSLT